MKKPLYHYNDAVNWAINNAAGVFVSFGTKISAGKVLKSGKGYAFFGV